MTPNLMLLLLELVVTVTAGKYVYEQQQLNWTEAQTYCRTKYTDLAPVSNEYDQSLLNKMIPGKGFTWIGLMRNTTDRTKWMWSGGSAVTECFWGLIEPNGITTGEDVGAIYHHSWVDIVPASLLPFFCYKVHAVRERMTWDDALQYCRTYHHDLASVASETEMMLIEKELRKDLSTIDVWIGLHFLDANWQWLDGQPFQFENWGPFEKPICPDITFACGALRVQGPVQKGRTDTFINVNGIKGWNARDCTLKLDVLCY